MKITCGVEILNRAHPAVSARNKTKYSTATLALCHNCKKKELQSDKDVNLIVCTHQHPTGSKYKVFNNVEKLFTKFSNDGKATIRFKQPPHDLLISKADSLQLKGFLHGVGLTLVGQGGGRIRLSAPPLQVERPREKMSVERRSDYPGPRASFPATLTWLQVHHCSLARVEGRVLALRHLQVLDLGHNALAALPPQLGALPLRELVLHHNRIRRFPAEELADSALARSLHALDLSFNEIRELSPYFCLMKNIAVLSLKGNGLKSLPRNIHCLEKLRIFSASHNDLKVLPFGIRKLHLDTLDLFHNPLDSGLALRPSRMYESPPALKDLAAAAALDHRVALSPAAVPRSVLDFVVDHCPCPCGGRVFQRSASCTLVVDLYKLASTVVYINNTSRFKVPLEVFFCSPKCWRK